MKILKAINLLLYTTLAINEIADITGFTDSPHFCKVFFKKNGTTPHQYRSIYGQEKMPMSLGETQLSFDIINYIQSNYTRSISIFDVAEAFLLTPKEVNKILLYTVEQSFGEFLKYLRINKASELLLTTDDKIVDICMDVGYNNVKTFNNHFLQLKKMKPSEFRKETAFDKHPIGEYRMSV